MKSCWHLQTTERAQPWLGTVVSIRVDGLPPANAHSAITAAFEEVALVHRLMSFHEPESDVSQLNRAGSIEPIKVHPHTLAVLRQATFVSAVTGGCFDVSIGAQLVQWGWLPRPTTATALPQGTWQDIEIHADGAVGFRRPVWIDLGGIAKGYAVDCAVACLRAQGVARAVVNAGGDIRVLGPQAEPIVLNLETSTKTEAVPVLELADGSVASSSGHRQRRIAKLTCGPHVDGSHRTPASSDRFVCVLAESCMVADALTKVVMANGLGSANVLGQFGASAHLFDAATGWHSVNSGTECA